MSDIGKAFRTHLVAQAAITALVSSRVYPDVLDQAATLPAIRYQVISSVEEHGITGLVGLTHVRLQVDAYAATRTAAHGLAEAIRNEVAGFRGNWDTVFVAGATVTSGERAAVDRPRDGSKAWRYIAGRDFLVSFQDA